MREVQVDCLTWMLCTSGFAYEDGGWNSSRSMYVPALCQTLFLDLTANCLFLETCSIDKVRDVATSAGAV